MAVTPHLHPHRYAKLLPAHPGPRQYLQHASLSLDTRFVSLPFPRSQWSRLLSCNTECLTQPQLQQSHPRCHHRHHQLVARAAPPPAVRLPWGTELQFFKPNLLPTEVACGDCRETVPGFLCFSPRICLMWCRKRAGNVSLTYHGTSPPPLRAVSEQRRHLAWHLYSLACTLLRLT